MVRVLRAMLLRMCETLPVAEDERIGYLTHPSTYQLLLPVLGNSILCEVNADKVTWIL